MPPPFPRLFKDPHAVILGRKGGSKNTEAQIAARRVNAKKGGWPKGRKRKQTTQNKTEV